MLRIVLDTNIVISGMLWSGTPHEVMNLALQKKFVAYATEAILDELAGVLSREKFTARLSSRNKSSTEIVNHYAEIVKIIDAKSLETQVSEDIDDDIFIACAASAIADYIVSGDPHLLKLKKYDAVSIVDARTFLDKFKIQL